MEARFVGKSSCGFKHGHSYCIYSRVRDDRLIWIYDKNSRAQCSYQSLESFLANWNPLFNFKKSLTNFQKHKKDTIKTHFLTTIVL